MSDGDCRIGKLKEDFAVSLSIHKPVTATHIDVIAEKKAQEREAESRMLSASSPRTPRSPTASISNMPDWKGGSDRPTLESPSKFPTHTHHIHAHCQILGIMCQHTPAATQKRLALQDPNCLVNNTELNSLGNDVIDGSYTIESSSLPGSLPDGELLATRLENLGVYATPPLTFSPSLLTPHSLDSALAGIDNIEDSRYGVVSRSRLHGNDTFNETDDFLHDNFMPASQDSLLDTYYNLQPQLQSPLQLPYPSISVTPVSQSAMHSRHASQIDLTKRNGRPQGPTRSQSELNKARVQSSSKRSKDDDDDENDDDGCFDDENGSDDGRPLLHIPVENGHEGIVRILLGNGADVNQRDSSRGFTALHIAISQKHEAVLRLLIESGANLNITDNLGRTPLHLAAQVGNEAGVRILLARGADLSLKAGRRNRKSSID